MTNNPSTASAASQSQNIDYAPTFLEACGIPIPPDMHGTSLLRVIEDGAEIHEDL